MVEQSELAIDQAIKIIKKEACELEKTMETENIGANLMNRYGALNVALRLMENQNINTPVLLSLQEVCEYTGWGMTKARQILKRSNSSLTVRMGNRLYANKKLFDEYLERCAKYQIPI